MLRGWSVIAIRVSINPGLPSLSLAKLLLEPSQAGRIIRQELSLLQES